MRDKAAFRLIPTRAHELRARFGGRNSPQTFTHIGVREAADAALLRFRGSTFADVLLAEGTLLNRLGDPPRQVEPIHATVGNLDEVYLTASTWEGQRSRGSIEARFVYREDDRVGFEGLVAEGDGTSAVLTHICFDNQKAETGYGGDQRRAWALTAVRASEFVALIDGLGAIFR